MSTRTRTRSRLDEPLDEALREDDLAYETAYGLHDEITDDDIEAFLHAKEAEEEKPGFWNLPTAAGLATIGVGSAYLLQELGVFASGFDFSAFLGPWLIGVLIILVGFGVLSWSPDRQRRRQHKREQAARRRARASARRSALPQDRRQQRTAEREARRAERYERRRSFAKSRTNRKIAGVCGGIGEYLGVDPTLIRIAFVIALIAGAGSVIPIYLLMAWLMPSPEQAAPPSSIDDNRVIIIR